MATETRNKRNLVLAAFDVENIKEMQPVAGEKLPFRMFLYRTEHRPYGPADLRYDVDWNWLMGVERKIVGLCIADGSDENGEQELFMSEYYTSILETVPMGVIEDAYKVIYEFIEWYNSIQK